MARKQERNPNTEEANMAEQTEQPNPEQATQPTEAERVSNMDPAQYIEYCREQFHSAKQALVDATDEAEELEATYQLNQWRSKLNEALTEANKGAVASAKDAIKMEVAKLVAEHGVPALIREPVYSVTVRWETIDGTMNVLCDFNTHRASRRGAMTRSIGRSRGKPWRDPAGNVYPTVRDVARAFGYDVDNVKPSNYYHQAVAKAMAAGWTRSS